MSRDSSAVHTLQTARPGAINLLGVRIDCLRRSELLAGVVRTVRDGRRQTIFYVNAHCLNVQARDARYRAILSAADTVYCDGMGVLLGARLTGQTIPERMTGPDWIEDLCRTAVEHDLSLAFLGSTRETVHGAATTLRRCYPGLRIVGEQAGYDLTTDTPHIINAQHPDILLVGMGVPVQEQWIAQHRPVLDVPVVWAVGGLFDVVSGRVPRGPSWMTQHGLEWLCRLMIEPGRLWRRYLLGNPRFLWNVLITHGAPSRRSAREAVGATQKAHLFAASKRRAA